MREAYANRDKREDSADPENPTLPPEAWEGAVIGKYYRPLKTPISLRLDADVLGWLKSEGAGYQARINAILRESMEQATAPRLGLATKRRGPVPTIKKTSRRNRRLKGGSHGRP
jgi:uncharacterized protein (DUF4415 family)